MNSKIYGYARVSTQEQNLGRQLIALREYGIEERDIIVDKVSGKDFSRDSYQMMKEQLLRPGDTVVIKELDRFGRDYGQMKAEWMDLEQRGIFLVVLDTPLLNTMGKSDLERKLLSNIVFEIFSYTANKERDKLLQRQREGIAAAKAKNVKFGRPSIKTNPESNERFSDVIKGRITATYAMKALCMKRTTFYKLLNEYKSNSNGK